MKICIDCNVEKHINEFNKYCRFCQKCGYIRRKKYLQQYTQTSEFKEHSHKYQKEYRDARKHRPERKQKVREFHLKHEYNITLIEYDIMFKNQKGCCDICHKHQSEFKLPLYVDHDHKTDKVRGLLCKNCNMALGFMKDDPDIILEAYNYIKKSTDN